MSLVRIHDPLERQLEAPREAARVAWRLVPGRLPPLPFFLQVLHSVHTQLCHIWGTVNLRMHISSDTTPWSQRQSENVSSCWTRYLQNIAFQVQIQEVVHELRGHTSQGIGQTLNLSNIFTSPHLRVMKIHTFGHPESLGWYQALEKLESIVVGKHNELSEGGHMILEAMACSRAEKLERSTGRASLEKKMEQGVIQGELRRQLSVVNLRASMACLLDRLHQCGEGGRLRNRREEWRVREEERMREERELHFANRLKGRSLLQPSRILHRH